MTTTVKALLLTSACVMGSASALAQASAQPQAETADMATASSSDIIVTARRRAERLQDIPVSVSAYDDETLKRAGVTQLDNLAQVSPGFTAQASPFGGGAMTVTIRSQRQFLPNVVYDPSVPIYFADVVQARLQGTGQALFDLQSVQVLKGPQGTLFGRNSTGGSILLSPTAPTDTVGGYGDLTIGNYDQRRLEAALNLPIAEGALLRVSGIYDTHDGYIDNPNTGRDLDDRHSWALRGFLRLEPAPGIRNDLIIQAARDRGEGSPYKLIAVNPAGPAAFAAAELTALAQRSFYTSFSNSPPNGTRINSLMVVNTTTFDLGGATLKNIFGFRKVKAALYSDLDGSSYSILDINETVRAKQYSNELLLQGALWDNNLEYTLGLFGLQDKGKEGQLTQVFGAGPNNVVKSLDAINSSLAGYAQLTYHLPWLPGVSATVGIRETKDWRKLTTEPRFTSGNCQNLGADNLPLPNNACAVKIKATFDQLTWTLALDWKINRDLLVYVTNRKGYRAGGFVDNANSLATFVPFRPETVIDTEIGLKAGWQAGGVRGRTTIAAYYDKYDDIQKSVTDLVPDPANPGNQVFVGTIINAASATIKGFEIEQNFNIADVVDLNLGYAYSDASYDDFVLNSGADYTNAPFASAPKHAITGSVRFHAPAEDKGDFYLQVDGLYKSRTVVGDVTSFNPVNQSIYPTAIIPSYAVFNARVDWENILGRSLNAGIFVRNITNKNYYASGIDPYPTLGITTRLPGAPRTYGVEARVSF